MGRPRSKSREEVSPSKSKMVLTMETSGGFGCLSSIEELTLVGLFFSFCCDLLSLSYR